MGWFSNQEESSLPNREKRRKCWETRDAYFVCLDRVGVVKAGDEKDACSKEKKLYETNCAKSWVHLLFLFENFFFSRLTTIIYRLNTSTKDG